MLTSGERDELCALLERSRGLALAAFARISAAQWRFRRSAEAWSVGEIVEHIAVSETVVYETLQQVLAGPPAPERKAEAAGKDRLIIVGVPRRRIAVEAPPAMRPAARYAGPEEAAAAFSAARGRTLDFVRATTADLRSYFAHHPTMQWLDGYQWLLLAAVHTERHLAQLDQWAKAPDYPHA
jgi:hypothetical protein